MPIVATYEDVKHHNYTRRGATHTPFLAPYPHDEKPPRSLGHDRRMPEAFMSRMVPSRVISPHAHEVDEFLVTVEGGGQLGRTGISKYTIFFAGGYTQYGPITADATNGLTHFVLFVRPDLVVMKGPGANEIIKTTRDRKPIQIVQPFVFPSEETSASQYFHEAPKMRNEQGRWAGGISLPAHAVTAAPDPSHGDGQYLLIVNGSLIYQGREYPAYTVIFIDPSEPPFKLEAGALGMDAIVVNFPTVPTAKSGVAASNAADVKVVSAKWQCDLCAFVYDESTGFESDNLAPGTRWEDVPEDWVCPDCAAGKSDFRKV